jgi:hypothetical protein
MPQGSVTLRPLPEAFGSLLRKARYYKIGAYHKPLETSARPYRNACTTNGHSLQDVQMDARSVSAHSDMNGAAVMTATSEVNGDGEANV